MPHTPTSPELIEAPRLRFIPFRRDDLLMRLCSLDEWPSSDHANHGDEFDAGTARITRVFAAEFHELRQEIKSLYSPYDPDADTRSIGTLENIGDTSALTERLTELLNRANYERLTERDLKRAFRSASLFKIRLKVDMKAFSEVLLFARGVNRREETISYVGGLIKRRVTFLNYDRVLLYLCFADVEAIGEPNQAPGRVMIKLFQNVPEADLEMLFPNTEVAMRLSDRLLIGVPALASGAVIAFTKLGTPLLLLGTLLGFWLGLSAQPVTLDKQGLVIISAGLGAVAGYIWKQFSNYRNRKAKFRQALTQNLYFKLLDNNAGVLLRILDDAEDSECKEAWVALRFLMQHPDGIEEAALDQEIEAWFVDQLGAEIDFEIDDALNKLARLGLAARSEDRWYYVPSNLSDEFTVEPVATGPSS
ncbi:MAG: TMEM143 family protein [Halieaceae bacterium]|nr:TMEM143 family protein [Halieaceae bacterium]